MTDGKHLSTLQDHRLGREFPGDLQPLGTPAGDKLLPKLGAAIVLGVLLAAVGGLTEDRPELSELEQLAAPGTAGPPEIVVQEENSDRTQY